MNNDLISREALKKEVKTLFCPDGYKIMMLERIDNAPTVETDIEVVAKDAYEHGYTDGWKERFGEPNGRPQGEWIPVSERLPEESLNSVIGWDAYRERCVFVQYIDGHFQITGSDESFNIVAWQPLPKPYESEAEELYNQAAVEYTKYCERYEPTYNPDDGSM